MTGPCLFPLLSHGLPRQGLNCQQGPQPQFLTIAKRHPTCCCFLEAEQTCVEPLAMFPSTCLVALWRSGLALSKQGEMSEQCKLCVESGLGTQISVVGGLAAGCPEQLCLPAMAWLRRPLCLSEFCQVACISICHSASVLKRLGRSTPWRQLRLEAIHL